MERMTPLSAAFLQLEDAQPGASLAISSIAIFEGPAPSPMEFRAHLAGRLPLIPRYRQKVRQVPLDLGAPVWVDDPDFDLSYHLRRTAVPSPGGDHELADLMARIMSQRLDRDRPLWEYWLVEGLADGRWALISKLHHCIVDGVSGTDLYNVVLDPSPDPAPPVPDDWQPRPEPSTGALTALAARDLVRFPWDAGRAMLGTLLHPADLARTARDTVVGAAALSRALLPTPASSLSGPLSAHRRFAFARCSIDDVRLVRKALGGTFNDVALAAVTAGYRALLLGRGEEPTPRLIRTLVPVSTRAPGEEKIPDNRVSLLLARLPVHLVDGAERLAAVREEMGRLKAEHEAEAGAVMMRVAVHQPFAALAPGMRLTWHLPQRNIITVTTNVPGPRQPLYARGRRMLELIPYVPIASRVKVGISMMTYEGRLVFGVTGDWDREADVQTMAQGIEDGMAELVAAARATEHLTASTGPAAPAGEEAPAAARPVAVGRPG